MHTDLIYTLLTFKGEHIKQQNSVHNLFSLQLHQRWECDSDPTEGGKVVDDMNTREKTEGKNQSIEGFKG